MADFKIQHITATIANGSTTKTLSAPTDFTAVNSVNSAFILINSVQSTGLAKSSTVNNINAYVRVSLSDASTIVLSRAGVNSNAIVSLQIVEYIGQANGPNEFIVRQTGTLNTNNLSGQGISYTISGFIDETKLVPIHLGVTSGANNQSEVTIGRFYLDYGNNALKVESVKDDFGANCTYGYSLVEFTGYDWNVQQITHTISADDTDETETTNPYNGNACFVLAGRTPVGSSGNGDDQGFFCYPSTLPSATSITFRTNSNTGTITAFIISNKNIRSVQINPSMTSTNTTNDTTLSGFSSTNTMLVAGHGYSSNTGAISSSDNAIYYINSSTVFRLDRTGSSGQIDGFFQVVNLDPPVYQQQKLSFKSQNTVKSGPRDFKISFGSIASLTKQSPKLSFRGSSVQSTRFFGITFKGGLSKTSSVFSFATSLTPETYRGFISKAVIQGTFNNSFLAKTSITYTSPKNIKLSFKGNPYGGIFLTFKCQGAAKNLKLSFRPQATSIYRFPLSFKGAIFVAKGGPKLSFRAQAAISFGQTLSFYGQTTLRANSLKISYRTQNTLTTNSLKISYRGQTSIYDGIKISFRPQATTPISQKLSFRAQNTLSANSLHVSYRGQYSAINNVAKFSFRSQNTTSNGIKLSLRAYSVAAHPIRLSYLCATLTPSKIKLSFRAQSATSSNIKLSFRGQSATSNKIKISFYGQANSTSNIKLSFRSQNYSSNKIRIAFLCAANKVQAQRLSFAAKNTIYQNIKTSFRAQSATPNKLKISFYGQTNLKSTIRLSFAAKNAIYKQIGLSYLGAYSSTKLIRLSFAAKNTIYPQIKLSFRTQSIISKGLIKASFYGQRPFSSSLYLTFSSPYTNVNKNIRLSFQAKAATNNKIALSYAGQNATSSKIKLSFRSSNASSRSLKLSFRGQTNAAQNIRISYRSQAISLKNIKLSFRSSNVFSSKISYSYRAKSSAARSINLTYSVTAFTLAKSINLTFSVASTKLRQDLHLTFRCIAEYATIKPYNKTGNITSHFTTIKIKGHKPKPTIEESL